jgi:hypothetical protein
VEKNSVDSSKAQRIFFPLKSGTYLDVCNFQVTEATGMINYSYIINCSDFIWKDVSDTGLCP